MNLRWQRYFHPVLMMGCLIRAVFFALQPLIMENQITIGNTINLILNTLPSFLFFSNYLIILFLWAEIYHYAHEEIHVGIAKLRPIFISITVLMYGVIVLLYLLNYFLYPPHYLNVSQTSNYVEMTIEFFGGSIYALTSIGFILYGIRIYFKFSSIPIYTITRKQVLRKIQVITVLVSMCFFIRSAIVIVAGFQDISAYWWFDGVYYFFLELVPLFLMLTLLHGDNRKNSRGTITSDKTALLNG